MERRLKERLIGAAVLATLAVIFIPMVLDDTEHPPTAITATNIPPRPEGEFTSRIVPIPAQGAGKKAAPSPQTPPRVTPDPVPDAAAPPGADDPAPRSGEPAPTESAAPTEPGASTAARAEPAAPVTDSGADAPGKSREPVGLTAWVVQLGSFSSEENARALNDRLRKNGYAAFVEPLLQDGERVYRVRVGPELLRSEAQSLRERILAETELDGIVVGYP